MKKLPESDRLDIASLSGLFRNTTNSYKYLFFLSILNLIKEKDFAVEKSILLRKLQSEMLVTAWYPNIFFKLSFGSQDMISSALKQIPDAGKDQNVLSRNGRKTLRSCIEGTYDESQNYNLIRFVPYRILRPFFSDETRGIKDDLINKKISELADKYFHERRPLFCFDEARKKIILHGDWIEYLDRHQAIVEGWARWHWADYMQRRNPNIPAVTRKLFPPAQKESLDKQRKFWKSVIEQGEIRCIYSGRKIHDDYELDHFLPWRFVAHNQLWNLIPVYPAANSAKTDHLPAVNYIDRLADTHRTALSIARDLTSDDKWKKEVEPYITDLYMDRPEDTLDREKLKFAYRRTLKPLISIAKQQGFRSEWKYT